MKILRFDTDAAKDLPNFRPYRAIKEKIRTFDRIDYYKLGTQVVTHDAGWKIGRLLQTIALLFPALCSTKFRKLVHRSWKQFRSGDETQASIYVRKQIEIKIPKKEPEKLPPKIEPLVKEPIAPIEIQILKKEPEKLPLKVEPLVKEPIEHAELKIELPDKEVLTNEKIIEMVREIKNTANKEDLYAFINQMGQIPNHEQRAKKLNELFLELEDHEIIQYLDDSNADTVEKSCLNVLWGCRNMNDDKCKNILDHLLEIVHNKFDIKNNESLNNKLAEGATFDQIIYLLNSNSLKEFKPVHKFVEEAIIKDAQKFVEIMEPDQLHKYYNIMFIFSQRQDLKEIKVKFIREIAAQQKLNIFFDFLEPSRMNIELINELKLDELNAFLILLANERTSYWEGNNVDIDARTDFTQCVHFFDALFASLEDFLEKNLPAARRAKDPLGQILEQEKGLNFFACYDEFARQYPHMIVQAFHGIILALSSKIVTSNINFKSERQVRLDIMLTLIDQIRERHPELKESISRYLAFYSNSLLEMIAGDVNDLGILRVVLAVRENKNLSTDQIKKLSEILLLPCRVYRGDFQLSFLFAYLNIDQQKILIRYLLDKYEIFREKNDWTLFNARLNVWQTIKYIRQLLTEEEINQLELDPQEHDLSNFANRNE